MNLQNSQNQDILLPKQAITKAQYISDASQSVEIFNSIQSSITLNNSLSTQQLSIDIQPDQFETKSSNNPIEQDYSEPQKILDLRFYFHNIINNISDKNDLKEIKNLGKKAVFFLQSHQFDMALKIELLLLSMAKLSLTGNHQIIAQALDRVGDIYMNRNDIQIALNYFIESLNMQQDLYPGDDHLESIASLSKIGLCYMKNEDFCNATHYLLQSYLMFQKSSKEKQSIVAIRLLEKLGECQLKTEDYPNALESFLLLHKMQTEIDSIEDPQFFIFPFESIRKCYQKIGNNQPDLKSQIQQLELQQKLFGENDPLTAASFYYLGQFYLDIGDVQIALYYHEQSLKIRQEIYSEDNWEIIESLNQLALCHRCLRDFRSALHYYLLTLKMQQRVRRDDYQSIAATFQSIAECNGEIGNDRVALYYILQSLQTQEKLLLGDSAETAYILQSVGICYIKIGDFPEGIDYIKQSLNMMKTLHPNNNADVAVILSNLGLVLLRQGSILQDAYSYFQQSYNMRKELFKDNHPSIAESLYHLGCYFQKKNQLEKAIRFLRRSYNMSSKFFERNHPFIAFSCFEMGNCFRLMNEYQNALKYSQESLSILLQLYQGNHPQTLRFLLNVGHCFLENGDSKKALDYFLYSLKMCQEKFKGVDEQKAEILINIGKCYKNIEDNQKAIIQFKQSLKVYQQLLNGDNSVVLSQIYGEIAECYMATKDYRNGSIQQLHSLQINQDIFQGQSDSIAKCFNNLGRFYELIGDDEMALQYSLEALQLVEKIFGENHILTAKNILSVFVYYIKIGKYENAQIYHRRLEQILSSYKSQNMITPQNPQNMKRQEVSNPEEVIEEEIHDTILKVQKQPQKSSHQQHQQNQQTNVKQIEPERKESYEQKLQKQMMSDLLDFYKEFSKDFSKELTFSATDQNKQSKKENQRSVWSDQMFVNMNKGYVFPPYFTSIQSFMLKKLVERQCFLGKFLAQGGEGIIFDGYMQNSEGDARDVIFKLLFYVDKEEMEEELEIMRSFENHNNIVQLIDYFQINEDISIIVLQKCKHSLKEELLFIEKEKVFRGQRLFNMMVGLFDGLIQLRIYKVLHMDIKPENILIGEYGQCVYTDFGISEIVRQNRPIQNKGYTLKYASIEQVNDETEKINYSTDIYSLGKMFQDILRTFKKVNKIQDCDKQVFHNLDLLIRQMIDFNHANRGTCKDLHLQFLSIFQQSEGLEDFLNEYSVKVQKILLIKPFEKNKDFQYALDIKVHYIHIQEKIYNFITRCLNRFGMINNNNIEQLTIQKAHLLLYHYLRDCYNIQIDDPQKELGYQLNSLEVIKELYPENDLLISASLDSIGVCYQYLGQTSVALSYHQESLSKVEGKFYENNYQIASTLQNIAKCYLELEQDKRALQFQLQALSIVEELFQEENEQIASAYDLIGQIYLSREDYLIAWEYILESFKIRLLLYPNHHPFKSISLGLVGVSFMKNGRYQEAVKYLIASHQMMNELFTGNQNKKGITHVFLGDYYLEIGEYQNAINHYEESMKMENKEYLKNHFSISTSYEKIAKCYRKMGNYQTALCYELKSLEMRQQIFKDNHPSIAASLYYIGEVYLDQGDIDNGLNYFQKSLTMRSEVYKGNHIQIVDSLNKVALCFQHNENCKEAIKYALKSLKMQRKLFPRGNLSIATTLSFIGSCYGEIRNAKDALSYLLKSLKIKQRIFKGNHPEIALTLDSIGIQYIRKVDFETGQKYLMESMQMNKELQESLGNHPHPIQVTDNIFNIGIFYFLAGEYEQAESFLQQSLTLRRSLNKDSHPSHVESLYSLGCLHREMNSVQKALEYLFEAQEIASKIFKKNNLYMACCNHNIGLCYKQMNQPKDAIKFSLKALLNLQEFYKERSHYNLQIQLSVIAECYCAIGDIEIGFHYKQESLYIPNQEIDVTTQLTKAKNLMKIVQSEVELENFGLALKYLLQSLDIFQGLKEIPKGHNRLTPLCFMQIGQCYVKMGDVRNAMFSFLKALHLEEEIIKRNIISICNLLIYIAGCYEEIDDEQMKLNYTYEAQTLLHKRVSKYTPNVSSSDETSSVYGAIGDRNAFLVGEIIRQQKKIIDKMKDQDF